MKKKKEPGLFQHFRSQMAKLFQAGTIETPQSIQNIHMRLSKMVQVSYKTHTLLVCLMESSICFSNSFELISSD